MFRHNPELVIEELSIEEGLSLSPEQIKQNILYVIKNDILDEIVIYASHGVNLKLKEYFRQALNYSNRILRYLIQLYPDFNYFDKDTWSIILRKDLKFVYQMIDLCEIFDHKDELPLIDDIVRSMPFRFAIKDQPIMLLQKFYNLGSRVVNKKVTFECLNKIEGSESSKKLVYEDCIDFLIKENQIANETIIDYFVPEGAVYNQKDLYTQEKFLWAIFEKYELTKPKSPDGQFINYLTKSKIYKAIKFAVKHQNLQLVKCFYEAGYKLKGGHFNHIFDFNMVNHIIENYQPNEYAKYVKHLFIQIQKFFHSEKDEIKQSESWRYFFKYWEKRMNNYTRFKALHEGKNIVLEYSKEYVNFVKSSLKSELSDLPDDIINYCIAPFLY